MRGVSNGIMIMIKFVKSGTFVDLGILMALSCAVSFSTWVSSVEVGSGDAAHIGKTTIRTMTPFIPYWSWGMDGAGFAWQALFFSLVALSVSVTNSQVPIYIAVFVFSPIAIGALATYLLARYSIGNRFGALFACLLFGWNTHSLVGLHGGQFLQVAPITFMPVILYVAIRAIEVPAARRWRWLAALAFAIQAMFDPRLCYVTLLGVGIMLVAVGQTLPVPAWRTGLASVHLFAWMATGALIVQAPWLAGMLSNPGVSPLPASYSDGSFLSGLSVARVVNVMSLHHPYFPSQLVWDTSQLPLGGEALAPLGVLLILGAWLGRRNPLIVGASVAFVASAFLAKGVQPPWEGVFRWIFAHVPGMSMFRDPVKWLPLACLFGSILVGVSARELGNALVRARSVQMVVAWLVPLAFLGMAVVTPVVPHLAPGVDLRGGLLAREPFTAEDTAFNAEMASRGEPFRVLVVPWGASRIEHSFETEVWPLYSLVLGQWGPFIPPSDRMIDHYANLLGSPLFRSLLRIGNFRYVVVPPDPDGWVFGRDRQGFGSDVPGFDEMTRMVGETTGLTRRVGFSNRAVFDVPDPMGPVFAVRQLRTGDRERVARDGLPATVVWAGERLGNRDLLLGLPDDAFHASAVSIKRIAGGRLAGRLALDESGWLVLSEEYAVAWRAYLVPASEAEPSLLSVVRAWPSMRGAWWWLWPGNAPRLDRWALTEHVRVNAYMQAWHMPVVGAHWVVIEYLPQRAYEGGWIVTLLSLAVSFFMVTAWCVKSTRNHGRIQYEKTNTESLNTSASG